MLLSILETQTTHIHGKFISLFKEKKPFPFLLNPRRSQIFAKHKLDWLERSFLTTYLIKRLHGHRIVGKISLSPLLDKYGATCLKYEYSSEINEDILIDTFSTLFKHISQFYGWSCRDEEEKISVVFQEVKIDLEIEDKCGLVSLLKSGMKICFVGSASYTLRHRYQDNTGLAYEDVAHIDELSSAALAQLHYNKIELAIRKEEILQGTDLQALKFYLKQRPDALGYYLALLENNLKFSLAYATINSFFSELF